MRSGERVDVVLDCVTGERDGRELARVFVRLVDAPAGEGGAPAPAPHAGAHRNVVQSFVGVPSNQLHVAAFAIDVGPAGGGDCDLRAAVERVTRRLLHTSQHDRFPQFLGGRLQEDINALRAAAGLEQFGWLDAVPDEEVGRCTVHSEDCVGQHTHNPPVPGPP